MRLAWWQSMLELGWCWWWRDGMAESTAITVFGDDPLTLRRMDGILSYRATAAPMNPTKSGGGG